MHITPTVSYDVNPIIVGVIHLKYSLIYLLEFTTGVPRKVRERIKNKPPTPYLSAVAQVPLISVTRNDPAQRGRSLRGP